MLIWSADVDGVVECTAIESRSIRIVASILTATMLAMSNRTAACVANCYTMAGAESMKCNIEFKGT